MMTAITRVVNHAGQDASRERIINESLAAQARERAKRVHACTPKPKPAPTGWAARIAAGVGCVAILVAWAWVNHADQKLAKVDADNAKLAAMIREHQDASGQERFVAHINVPRSKAEQAMAAAVASLTSPKGNRDE